MIDIHNPALQMLLATQTNAQLEETLGLDGFAVMSLRARWRESIRDFAASAPPPDPPSKRAAKAKRPPKPIQVDQLRARVLASRGEREGLWYWQIRKGSKALASKRMTRDACMRQMVEMATGMASASRGEPETIETMLQLWLGTVVARREKDDPTRRVYTVAARRLTLGVGEVLLPRVTRDTLVRYADLASQGGYAASTVRLDLQVLGIAWKWAAEIGRAPAVRPRSPRVKGDGVYNRRTPTWAELEAVLDALGPGPHADALALQAACGARINEICRIRNCDVESIAGALDDDSDTRIAWILLAFSKTGARRVPIRRRAAGVVARLYRPDLPDEHLLRYEAGRRAGHAVGQNFRNQVSNTMRKIDWEGIGVAPFATHGVRRLVANTLRDASVPLEEIAELLGNSPEQLLRAYRQVRPNAVLEAVERVGLGGGADADVPVPIRSVGR